MQPGHRGFVVTSEACRVARAPELFRHFTRFGAVDPREGVGLPRFMQDGDAHSYFVTDVA